MKALLNFKNAVTICAIFLLNLSAHAEQIDFHFIKGTGQGSWNSESLPAMVDDIVHQLHTPGVPRPHGRIIAQTEAPPEVFTTVTGAKYHLVHTEMPEQLGTSYVDQEGLIWGDVMHIGEAVWMTTGQKAKSACEQIETQWGAAHLPTADEFIKMRESMSDSPNPNSKTELDQSGESKNSFYNVLSPAIINIGKYYGWTVVFWSSSRYENGNYYNFDSGSGDLTNLAGNYYTPFRCVVQSDLKF